MIEWWMIIGSLIGGLLFILPNLFSLSYDAFDQMIYGAFCIGVAAVLTFIKLIFMNT